jgi:hypothetical protein
MMDTVSRPLIALLIGTVALFGLWFVALKPGGSSSSGSGKQALANYGSDIAKARQAVTTSNRSNAAAAGEAQPQPAQPTKSPAGSTAASTSSTAATSKAATKPSAPASNAAGSKPTSTASKPSSPSAATQHRLDVVTRALDAHKVVALLFYNPASADDRAVARELAAVPRHRGRVVKLAVPLSELSRYTVVTTQVPVNFSPTLVLIDGRGQATTIVGFADRFEISQRLADALAAR